MDGAALLTFNIKSEHIYEIVEMGIHWLWGGD